MPDFVQRLQVLRGARFEFLLWAVASFGGSFITYLWGQPGIPVWISGWVVLVWLLVLFVIILLNAERRVADAEKDTAKGDLEAVLRRETMEHRDTSI